MRSIPRGVGEFGVVTRSNTLVSENNIFGGGSFFYCRVKYKFLIVSFITIIFSIRDMRVDWRCYERI